MCLSPYTATGKLLFDGVLFAPASVGEATSLPRGTTLKKQTGSGEFVQFSNIFPFNKPLKKLKRGGRLIASPTMGGHKTAR